MTCSSNSPLAAHVGKTLVGGVDLNKARMRHVVEAVIAFASSASGFTASQVAAQVRLLSKLNPFQYSPRHPAYDLKKLRSKHIACRCVSAKPLKRAALAP